MSFSFAFWRFLDQITHLVCYCSFLLRNCESSFPCWNATLQSMLSKTIKKISGIKQKLQLAKSYFRRAVFCSDMLLSTPLSYTRHKLRAPRGRGCCSCYTLLEEEHLVTQIVLAHRFSKRPLNMGSLWLQHSGSGEGTLWERGVGRTSWGSPEVFTRSFTYIPTWQEVSLECSLSTPQMGSDGISSSSSRSPCPLSSQN